MLEKDLYKPIIQEKAISNHLLYEVKIYNRKIDLLLVGKAENTLLIAFEFKIRDWKKAFFQAFSYKIVADYVYIALYYKNIRRVNIEMLKNNGVGLLAVSPPEKYDLILEAKKSNVINDRLRKKILEKGFIKERFKKSCK